MSHNVLQPLAPRRKTRTIRVGSVQVGGDSPITVQSMTKTDTRDVEATLAQIHTYAQAGCEIVRLAIPDLKAAQALAEITPRSPLPVVADIHFDHRLALVAADGGAACLRINPGNIGGQDRVRAVVQKAGEKGLSIRIGVNAGSLEKEWLDRFGGPTAEAMVASALGHLELLEREGFFETKLSLKASDIPRTVQAYRMLSRQTDYPLHLGLTEAGTPFRGTIQSSAALGILLAEGIGDTIRISLTGAGEEECRVGHELLRSLGLRSEGYRLISCPTCGRLQVDLPSAVAAIEQGLKEIGKEGLTYAVMGCVVNGPGEAREADLGVAGGKGKALLFKKGELVRTVMEHEMVEAFLDEARKLVAVQGGPHGRA